MNIIEAVSGYIVFMCIALGITFLTFPVMIPIVIVGGGPLLILLILYTDDIWEKQ